MDNQDRIIKNDKDDKEKLPYSIAIIKPDAHRDILAETIIKDIKENGLDIAFVKDMVLSREQAEKIYSDHFNEPHFEASVKSLMGEKGCDYVTVLIVESKDGPSLEKIQEIKGRSDKGGIRLKLRVLSQKELEERGFSGDELKEELAKNRLHVPDSDELNRSLINMLLTSKEIKELIERRPEVYKELRQISEKNRELKMLPPVR